MLVLLEKITNVLSSSAFPAHSYFFTRALWVGVGYARARRARVCVCVCVYVCVCVCVCVLVLVVLVVSVVLEVLGVYGKISNA